MAKSDDEPDLGEIKGLLRRLEGGSLQSSEAPLRRSQEQPHEEPGWVEAPQRRPSSAAVLILIANTVMATATITSIAWYFFHTASIQKSAQSNGESERQPVLHDTQAPSRAGAPSVEHLAVTPPAADASPTAGKAAPSERSGAEGSIGSAVARTSAAAPEDAQEAHQRAASEAAREETSKPPEPSDPTLSAHGQDPRDVAHSGSAEPVQQDTAQTKLIAKARELLASGQVAAARLLLQRAAEGGDAAAALLLAETFDPAHASFPGAGAEVGDKETARMWYERAAALGSSEAKARFRQ